MEKVVCRASAKVPIVKCWDPELKLAADLNVNNTLALENTRMIKTYVQLDKRVRPLAKIIKYWTKRRILNDAGEFFEHTVQQKFGAKTVHSVRRHNKLVHLDLHDHQLPTKTRSANSTIFAENCWSKTKRGR